MESLQDHQVEKGSNLMNEIQAERKELPIYEFKNEIVDVIKNNLFCVITGETGSGKSTQIAQYIIDNMTIKDFKQYTNQEIFSMLSAQINLPEQSNNKKSSNQISGIDRNHDSTSSNKLVKVVVTQPRRVAAIQMAKRVSYERQTSLGREVGYSIRFDDCTDSKGRTQIKYVTDGILVRECLLDPDLINEIFQIIYKNNTKFNQNQIEEITLQQIQFQDLNEYSVVVLDEAHERSLNTDILFALVKQAVLRRRGQLRLNTQINVLIYNLWLFSVLIKLQQMKIQCSNNFILICKFISLQFFLTSFGQSIKEIKRKTSKISNCLKC